MREKLKQARKLKGMMQRTKDREQTTIRLPAELKEQLQREAESVLKTLEKFLEAPEVNTWEEIRELRRFLVAFDEQYCCIMAEAISCLDKKPWS